jgi:hypothetical protein
MPAWGFEPTISAGERPKTYALERAATGIGNDDKFPTPNPSSHTTTECYAVFEKKDKDKGSRNRPGVA